MCHVSGRKLLDIHGLILRESLTSLLQTEIQKIKIKNIFPDLTHRKFKVCFNKLHYLSGKENSFIATQEILAHIEQWIFKDMHHLLILRTISFFIK